MLNTGRQRIMSRTSTSGFNQGVTATVEVPADVAERPEEGGRAAVPTRQACHQSRTQDAMKIMKPTRIHSTKLTAPNVRHRIVEGDDTLTIRKETASNTMKKDAPIKSPPQTASLGHFETPKRVRRLQVVSEDLPSALTLYRRVYCHKAPPRECIKAFCIECQGFSRDGIADCLADACPLWHRRPFQRNP